jgi:hypothetical protein
MSEDGNVTASMNDSTPTGVRQSKSHWLTATILGLVAVFLLIAAVGCAVFYFNGGSERSENIPSTPAVSRSPS